MLWFSFHFVLLILMIKLPGLSKATKCGGTLSAESNGIIRTPHYPDPYGDQGIFECHWFIEAPPGFNVRLEFRDFDIEMFDSNEKAICDLDAVKIRDGRDDNSPLLGKVYCGSTTPEILTSSGNVLSILLTIDESAFGESRGFEAMYSKVAATGIDRCVSSVCGGNYLNATSCEIQSPGYPSSYESQMNCSWFIEASHPDQKISVEFVRLNLNEDNSRCQNNKVTFYDSSTKSTSIFEPVCDLKHNRLTNKKIVSPGPRMLINFLTTESSGAARSNIHGFKMKFKVIDPPSPVTTTTSAPKIPITVKSSTTTTTTISTSTPTTTTTTTISNEMPTVSTTSQTISTTTLKKITENVKATSPFEVKSEPRSNQPDKEENDESLKNTTVDPTTAPNKSDPFVASPASISGLVLGIIVVVVVVVIMLGLLFAYRHWKKQNRRIARRLRDEDARSDANTLLSSSDSREFTDMSKKKQSNGQIISDRLKYANETKELL